MNRQFLTIVLTVFCAAGLTLADVPDPAARIAPFVNNFTFAVARIEPGKIDFDALQRWGEQALAQANMNENDRRVTREGLKDAIAAARKWSGEFTQAGGKSLWFVFTLETFPQDPVFLVVPLERGSNGPALLKLFGDQPNQPSHTMQLRGAIVAVPESQSLPSVRAIIPQPRPELGKALVNLDDAKAYVAVIPSEDARRVIASMVPRLPNGQETDALSAGVLWAAATINPPPGVSVNTVIQAKDAHSAKQLKQLLVSLAPSDNKADVLRKLVSDLTHGAQVNGDRVVIQAGQQQTAAAASQLAFLLHRARVQAVRERSASNMRQILLGMFMYANNHMDKAHHLRPLPRNLQELIEDQGMSPQVLVNPGNPGEKVGYVYIRPPQGFDAGADRVVLYEKYKKGDVGINLGFADGHVEFWLLKPAEEQIRKAEQAAAATQPAK